jgi:hypothetical protein
MAGGAQGERDRLEEVHSQTGHLVTDGHDPSITVTGQMLWQWLSLWPAIGSRDRSSCPKSRRGACSFCS